MKRFRDISLERKLPLLISLLLIIVIGALAWSAVREVRRIALLAARTRLESVASQFATSLAESYRRRMAALISAGRNDTLIGAVRAPSPRTRAAAEPLLAPLAADTPMAIGVEVRDAAGRSLFAIGNAGLIERLGPAPLPHADSAGIVGPIVQRNDTFAFTTTARIGTRGAPLGYVTQWRRITLSRQAQATISEFVGTGASVYFGTPGQLWVDLGGTRAEPPPRVGPGGGYLEFEREGQGLVLSVVRPIAATPRMIEVDFPRAMVLSQADVFLTRVGGVALVVLVLGIAAGWVLSRNITRPMRVLTSAAEEIAAGDFSRTVHADSRDEIGRLARAFGTMAARVRETHAGLEDQVTTRTGELRAALQTLKETQEELVRTERVTVLGQLSSSVGHELRNPLGVMSNAVYYLEAVLKDAPPKVTEYLGILRNQIKVSERIVTDLLDFARMKEPARDAVPLAPLLAEQLRNQPPPPHVKVETAIDPAVPAVYADRVHVGQILGNLASNAYQAMEESGGTLRIRATADGPGNVQIEVSDTGPGIAPENLEKIFEPLFTTRARGIGLGLPLSRTLAQTNGGSLTVTSRPGAGATFVLVLPAGSRERV